MDPEDELIGYAFVADAQEYIDRLEQFGETADNYDCREMPNSFPIRAVYIISTYCGIRTLEVFYNYNI